MQPFFLRENTKSHNLKIWRHTDDLTGIKYGYFEKGIVYSPVTNRFYLTYHYSRFAAEKQKNLSESFCNLWLCRRQSKSNKLSFVHLNGMSKTITNELKLSCVNMFILLLILRN